MNPAILIFFHASMYFYSWFPSFLDKSVSQFYTAEE